MKKELEEAYDIPFDVSKNGEEYLISPSNELKEYFEIHISFRAYVRIIIETYPQSHAADMLNDMAHATEEKKNLFFGYLDTFKSRGFGITEKVNDNEIDLRSSWPDNWRNLYIRLTRIEEQDADFEKEATESALLAAGMMLSLLNVVQTEDENIDGSEDTGYVEGSKYSVRLDRYERNPLNRELCLQANGYTCKICGFDFEKTYGDIGRHFIHVHHIHQLSLAGGPVKIDPVHDLIPVCPNCHAMLHTSTPPLMPDELRRIIKENKKYVEKQ